ncbi:MAG: hypothetical protein WBE86_15505 [Candidatus Acidiferrales bacterium]
MKKFLIGGSAKPLHRDDFRSARLVIPQSAFAYVKKFRVALDPVDLKTWTELQAAPDDVCLQTSEYHGSALKVQQELHGAWVEGIGFAEDDSLRDDALYRAAYEAEAEWQASTFASAHGFYRQAIETLRAALERTIIGLRYQDDAVDPHFKNWLEANETLSFQNVCDQIISGDSKVGALNQHLVSSVATLFVWHKRRNVPPEGWVGRLYEDLCHYSRCRPGHTSGSVWKGSGPVYDPQAFKLADRYYRQTATVCWFAGKIARPSLVFPDAVAAVVESAERSWKCIAKRTYEFLAGVGP